MSDRERKSVLSNIFTIGTPECAIFFAVAAMVLGLLILTIGFWKALLVAVLMLIALFSACSCRFMQIIRRRIW